MLLEYGMKNYFCFSEGVSISFRLDANCPESISQSKDFTPLLCIKGANGSGKTHALKGLAFLGSFCANSFSNEPNDEISISPFFNSVDPIELYAEFSVNNTLYLYELALTDKEIKRETLYRTKAKKTKIVERINNDITFNTQSLQRLNTIKLRSNASIISTAHQYELDELRDFYTFFDQIVSNVSYSGLNEKLLDIKLVSKFLHSQPEIFDFVKSFISECDTGISNIRIHSLDNTEGKKEFFPIFVHRTAGQENFITAVTESSGTKALFRTLGIYKITLDSGGVLIADEFDINLHPHILPKLLGLFLNPETNPKNAQIVVSTHNSEILNLLGRYRTYLVNKEDNQSYLYRLDEIPGDILRNDRPILPAYNDGKIGGIPRL